VMCVEPIRVLVTGAWGSMGRFVAQSVLAAPDMELVAAVDPGGVGHPVREIAPGAPDELVVSGHLVGAIEEGQPDVLVDFTSPAVVLRNIETALNHGVACVVGTTGLSDLDLKVIDRMARSKGAPCFLASNYSIGANLMMRFAELASTSFDHAEIIERHHDRKKDAPSGTAATTAQRMIAARGRDFTGQRPEKEHEGFEGARGAEYHGISVHAVRLPGEVADQEVLFGGTGEILRIEHITTSRECFMPGVMLAIRKVRGLEGLVRGLDQIMG
jgi:4-hydroxy-tetrahydrodipicolinate reductase